MIELYGRQFSRVEFEHRVGSPTQVCGITRYRYDDGGRSRGVRVIRIDTGRLCVDIVVDRGLDVARATLDGVPFMWRSANDIASPAFYDPTGDEWLRSFFGGWLTTCGLSNFGPAGADRWGSFGLHGRVDNIPANDIAVTTEWRDERCVFEVRGSLRESKALGANLALYRRWWTELASTTLHLEDRVVNEGSLRAPHMILYHCNAGFPLLDSSARVHVSHAAVEPRDAAARAGMEVWDRGGEPQPDFAEQVFIHTPVACADGRARAAVLNASAMDGRGLGFEIAFEPESLPALFSWRKLGYGDYVMSVEPANTRAIQGREFAYAHGLLPFLDPGEERTYRLDFTALAGPALTATAATIASANATRDEQR
jgi:hypothetical protein